MRYSAIALGLLLCGACFAGANQFVMIADIQNDVTGLDQMASEIIAVHPPFLIALGDQPTSFDPRANFFQRIREGGTEIHISMGNHDGGTRSELRQTLPPFPFNSEVAPTRFVVDNKYYYSFNRGGIHFVIVDTSGGTADQIEWLENDLIRHANNPNKYPALLFMHEIGWMLKNGPIYRMLAEHPTEHTVKAGFGGHSHVGENFPLEESNGIPCCTLFASARFGSQNQTEYVIATVGPDKITFERKIVLDDGKGRDFQIAPISGGPFTSLEK